MKRLVVGLLAHVDSGKTTLAEALLYLTKGTDRLGRVEDGNTVCDFDPEEAKRHASLALAVAPVEYDGVKINLLDAPGLFDFEVGMYEGRARRRKRADHRIGPQRLVGGRPEGL